MPINECCNLDIVCCEADTPIPQVAALMRTNHVGAVIVIEEQDGKRVPVGIVTDRDIVIQTIAQDVDANTFTAGDLMSAPLALVREDEGVVEALRMMRVHRVRRLPVITELGSLFGVVTADDLINLLATELTMLTDTIVDQFAREARVRS